MFNDSSGDIIFSNYWPASTTGTDIFANVVDDPSALFEIQADAAMPVTDLFGNFDIVDATAGSTVSGNSRMELDLSTGATTAALALLTSIAYFYAGIRKKGLGYFARYIEPAAFLLPINVLEDFTKPLSLTFRLFGNILADELVVGVLLSLVPLFVPVPIMLLGLFTSAIQALVFATLAGAYIGEALEDHH